MTKNNDSKAKRQVREGRNASSAGPNPATEKKSAETKASSGGKRRASQEDVPLPQPEERRRGRGASGGQRKASPERGAPVSNEEDFEDFEAPPGGVGKKSNAEESKQKLISMGKAKGFVTYDEVNDHLPDDIVSSDQIDEWLSTLGDEGIAVVDSASSVRVEPAKGAAKLEELDEDFEVKKEGEDQEFEEEEIEGYSKTNDPVRMYLSKMGSVSLLTREGEVEIAKRIEEGERRVLEVVLNSPVAAEAIFSLGDQLRKRKIRVKDVIRDVEDDDAEFDEDWHAERIVKLIEKAKRLKRENEKLQEKLDGKGGVALTKRKRLLDQIEENKAQMFDALSEVHLNKRQIENIVNRLKELVVRLDQAEAEITECERRLGMPAKDLRRTLRDVKSSAGRARAVAKKLGVRPEELEQCEEIQGVNR